MNKTNKSYSAHFVVKIIYLLLVYWVPHLNSFFFFFEKASKFILIMDLDKDPLPTHLIENWIRTKKKKKTCKTRERERDLSGLRDIYNK